MAASPAGLLLGRRDGKRYGTMPGERNYYSQCENQNKILIVLGQKVCTISAMLKLTLYVPRPEPATRA
jgi:hypothetical protein